MGRVICPSGISINVEGIDRTAAYEKLVSDIQDEKWKPAYRARCIEVVSKIGIMGCKAKSLVCYLHRLVYEEDEILRPAAIIALKKISDTPSIRG